MQPYPIRKPNMISSNRWSRFFAQAAEEHAGKGIRVEREVATVSSAAIGHSGRLEALDYQRAGGAHQLTVSIRAEELQEITVKPSLVWGIYNTEGMLVSVEVIDDHDRKLILNFDLQS
jgi:hypothetical protein